MTYTYDLLSSDQALRSGTPSLNQTVEQNALYNYISYHSYFTIVFRLHVME